MGSQREVLRSADGSALLAQEEARAAATDDRIALALIGREAICWISNPIVSLASSWCYPRWPSRFRTLSPDRGHRVCRYEDRGIESL